MSLVPFKLSPKEMRVNSAVKMTAEGTMILRDQIEIVPALRSDTGRPILAIYSIIEGREPDKRKPLAEIDTDIARLALRWLPMLINDAERSSRRQHD